jgi:hypothetical protein
VGLPYGDDKLILDAAKRWTNVITNGLAPVNAGSFPPLASLCPYPQVVDDLFICIVYKDIDGPNGFFGLATVDMVRTTNGLPIGGYFIMDTADVPTIRADGRLDGVLAHEIGHLLGK